MDKAPESRWELLRDAGYGALEANECEKAERLFLAALHQAEHFGSSDPRVLASIGDLLDLYDHLNVAAKNPEYERLCRRLLSLQEQRLGPEHEDLTPIIERLARTCAAQAKDDEAEQLYRRLLRMAEHARGPEHPDVASALVDLALHLEATHKYADAEAAWLRAIAITERESGADSAALVWMLADLARVYSAQGKSREAIAVLQRAIRIRERVHPEGIPDLADLSQQLAESYAAQGDDEEAERLYRQAVGLEEQALARESPEEAKPGHWALTRELTRQSSEEHLIALLRRHAGVLRRLHRETEARLVESRVAALQAAVDARAKLLQEVEAIATGGPSPRADGGSIPPAAP